MEEDKEFQIKILTEIMKKQQELINNIFNIVEKDYIEKSKFEEDEAVIEEIKKEVRDHIGFENRLKRESREPDLFNQGRFYVANNIKNILEIK